MAVDKCEGFTTADIQEGTKEIIDAGRNSKTLSGKILAEVMDAGNNAFVAGVAAKALNNMDDMYNFITGAQGNQRLCKGRSGGQGS